MQTQTAEFIIPNNNLKKKTGSGGLPQILLDKAQMTVDSLNLDLMTYSVQKINILKDQILSDEFITAENDNIIDDVLHNLVPLHVHMKLANTPGLSSISSNLLHFVEGLSNMNIDALHVIRAHINALDLITAKNIDASLNNPAIRALIVELNDACARYEEKYKKKN